MFQRRVVEKIKTHTLCSVTFFFENPTDYEIMWKNIVEAYRPQMTIQYTPIACWISKATNTHSEYVIFILTAKMVAQKLLNITLHVLGLSCVQLITCTLRLIRQFVIKEFRGKCLDVKSIRWPICS